MPQSTGRKAPGEAILRTMENRFASAREAMVRDQIEARGVRDPRVLDALRRLPRHLFVPRALWSAAHGDHPLPIGPGQTLSQPYMVAFMAEALALQPRDRVREVGSGSGYFAAVLAELAGEVYGIELEETLCLRARSTLDGLGLARVQLRCGDGTFGWPAAAPFDAIVLSCACPAPPPALLAQVAEDGRLLLPLGPALGPQTLVRLDRRQGRFSARPLLPVAFVPLRRAPGTPGGRANDR